jgi:hypothetical protein
MKCFTPDSRVPQDIYPFLQFIRNFAIEAPSYRTIDGYLTKLDTLFYTVEDYYGREKAGKIVEKILECEELREALRPLANYIDEVKELASNVRHAPTLRYLDILLKTLKELEPVDKLLEVTKSKRVESLDETHYSFLLEPGEATTTQQKNNALAVEENSVDNVNEGSGISITRALSFAILIIQIGVITILVLMGLFNSINQPSTPSYSKSNYGYSSSYSLYIPDYKVTSIQTLMDIRREVYGSYTPQSKVEAVLWLMSWASKNLKYGEANGRKINLSSIESPPPLKITVNYPALAPEEVLREKRGTCIDLALFYATALLSVNATPVYVIILKDAKHAVTGIEIDGVLYIIEATNPDIPPSEFSDYIEYLKPYRVRFDPPSNVKVFELQVSGQFVTYHDLTLSLAYDSRSLLFEKYMNDALPPTFARDIAEAIAVEKGLLVSEYARNAPMLILKLHPGLVSPQTNKSYPITRLYTPVFNEWWVKYYASEISTKIEPYRYKYIWIEVLGDDVFVYLA